MFFSVISEGVRTSALTCCLRQNFRKWLYLITGVYTLAPILLVSSIKFGDAWNVDEWVVVALHGLWLAAFLALFVLGAWAAIFRSFPRMEAWWLLSVPYAGSLFVTVLAFGGNELVSFLADLVYVYFASLVSAFVWMVGTFRQMAVGGARIASTQRLVMLGAALAVLLAPIIAVLLGGV